MRLLTPTPHRLTFYGDNRPWHSSNPGAPNPPADLILGDKAPIQNPCAYRKPRLLGENRFRETIFTRANSGRTSCLTATDVTTGTLFHPINKADKIWCSGFSPKVIWGVVKQKAKECEIPSLAPHDLRLTCARLCHQVGGKLEQIKSLLGHVSVQTTERYLGCKQCFRNAVKDRIGLEPYPQGSPQIPHF